VEHVRLHSGQEVAIRPIEPQDGPNLQSAYDRLSERSKYGRFLAVKPQLTNNEAQYLTQVDGCDHVALVATAPDDPDEILGVARFVRLPAEPSAAEFAIVVADTHQRVGLAGVLMARLAALAEQRGIHRFHATMLAGNLAAQRLVRSMAGEIVSMQRDGTVDEIDIDLRR
jgi:RimJ/RimL family protein N-acetyltransferase